MTVKAIIDEAGKLSREEQVELLEELMCIVGVDESEVRLTAAQQADLDRRIDEFRTGNAKMIPGDEVVARLRKRH
jgi:putative addiction module component (TIGR02574 family)